MARTQSSPYRGPNGEPPSIPAGPKPSILDSHVSRLGAIQEALQGIGNDLADRVNAARAGLCARAGWGSRIDEQLLQPTGAILVVRVLGGHAAVWMMAHVIA